MRGIFSELAFASSVLEPFPERNKIERDYRLTSVVLFFFWKMEEEKVEIFSFRACFEFADYFKFNLSVRRVSINCLNRAKTLVFAL